MQASQQQRVQVNEHAQSYSTTVTHPCGHRYSSASRWNTEASARKHAHQLLRYACSTCRSAA